MPWVRIGRQRTMGWRVARAARQFGRDGEGRYMLIGAVVLLVAGAVLMAAWDPLRHAVLGEDAPPPHARLMTLRAGDAASTPTREAAP